VYNYTGLILSIAATEYPILEPGDAIVSEQESTIIMTSHPLLAALAKLS
jgi:hypothetical protein